MSRDRFIRWPDEFPEWGPPDVDRIAATARDFLGDRWTVTVREGGADKQRCWVDCSSDDPCTFHLASEWNRSPLENEVSSGTKRMEAARETRRCFEVFFLVEEGKIDQTSVITRHCDAFTDALADALAAILARWWDGRVEKDD